MAALDILEVTHLLGAVARRAPAQTEKTTPARPTRPSEARTRWWFTFDGWRSAEREAEFVLA